MISLELHAVVLDDDGDTVEELHEFIEVGLAPLGLEGFTPEPPVGFSHEWTLRPGVYDLRVMVMDKNTGRIGTAQMDLAVPEKGGLGGRR